MFATTADELLTFFRADVNDEAAQGLWADFEAYGYMTEGFDALMKRAEVKYAVLQIPFLADSGIVPLPPKVLHIRNARIVGGDRITPASTNSLSTMRSDYGLQMSDGSALFTGSGTPEVYVRDYEAKALRLAPIPNVAGVLELQCSTTIGVAMAAGSPLPVTDSEDLRLVLHYMKHLAYQKHDAETEDLVRAKFHKDYFEEGARQRESQLRNFRRPPGVVRMTEW